MRERERDSGWKQGVLAFQGIISAIAKLPVFYSNFARILQNLSRLFVTNIMFLARDSRVFM